MVTDVPEDRRERLAQLRSVLAEIDVARQRPLSLPAVPRGRALLVWGGGVGLVVALSALIAAVVLLQPDEAQPGAAQAPLLASHMDPTCAQRLEQVAAAVAAFTREHGEAPQSLDELGPRLSGIPPIDPSSGKPLDYRRDGTWVSLACPSLPLSDP